MCDYFIGLGRVSYRKNDKVAIQPVLGKGLPLTLLKVKGGTCAVTMTVCSFRCSSPVALT